MKFFKKSQEIKKYKQEIKELKIQLDARKGIERYIFGAVEICDEDGNFICEIDRWVSRDLIVSAIETYLSTALARQALMEREDYDTDENIDYNK